MNFFCILLKGKDTAEAAADFHTTIASTIAEELIEQSTKAGITKICFFQAAAASIIS